MATGRTYLTSEEINYIKCCVCVEENRTKEAENYCVDCKNYYCSSCTGIAREKRHKILSKADFNIQGSDESLPSFPTQRCSMHHTEVVNMYCMDHDEVECASCIVLKHRFCKNVVSISKNIDNLYNKVTLNDVKLEFNTTKESLEKIKKTKETKLHELKGELNQKIESVKVYHQELLALFHIIEQETIQELIRNSNSIEASVAKDINEVESLVVLMNEAATQLKKSEGNKAQEFVCVKPSQKLVARAKEVEKNQQMTTEETLCFIPDQSIKEFLLQKKTLSTDNAISLIHKPEGQINTPPDELYRVYRKREIDVNLENDFTESMITGTCITEDGSLLLADNWNMRLKRMDMSTYKITAYVDLPTGAVGLCIISKTEAAVTTLLQTVQFVSLGRKMTVTDFLSMNHYCLDLAHVNGKLFITDNDRSVYIYSRYGEQLRRITKDSSGGEIFVRNQIIAVSASGEEVFVTDWFKGVVVLDSQGNYLSTHSDSSVIGYRGVCTDGKNVFVSGYESNNIVQFGPNFKLTGILGLVPVCTELCFDHQKKRLIASCYEHTKITILELDELPEPDVKAETSNSYCDFIYELDEPDVKKETSNSYCAII